MIKFHNDGWAVRVVVGGNRGLVARFQYRSYQTDKRWFAFTVQSFTGSGFKTLFGVSES